MRTMLLCVVLRVVSVDTFVSSVISFGWGDFVTRQLLRWKYR